jgi:hypothetical protein
VQRFFSPFLRADCISIPQEERGHKKVNKKREKVGKKSAEQVTSGGERMKKKGETRKVRTTFFLFHIRSSIRKHKKRKKEINPAPVAAPDGRVEQTVFFDFGPEENGIRSTSCDVDRIIATPGELESSGRSDLRLMRACVAAYYVPEGYCSHKIQPNPNMVGPASRYHGSWEGLTSANLLVAVGRIRDLFDAQDQKGAPVEYIFVSKEVSKEVSSDKL